MENTTVLDNIATLTQIPPYILERLSNTAVKEICHEVYVDHVLNKKETVSLNIGIGFLHLDINSVEGTVSYSFVPSRQLEKDLIHTLREESDILTEAIETNLNKKVLSLYRELA